MYQIAKKDISVKTIAKFLNAKYEGKDFKISKVSSLNEIKNNSLLFYSDIANFQFRIKDIAKYNLKKLEKYENILLITTEDIKKKINVPIISSKNPRLDFQRVIMKFFIKNEFKSEIHKTAIIENNKKESIKKINNQILEITKLTLSKLSSMPVDDKEIKDSITKAQSKPML